MRNTKNYTLHGLLLPCLICFVFQCGISCESKKEPEMIGYFNTGDVFLGDSLCPDTLIVTNAEGLNIGMGKIEQGLFDATEEQIDSVLHTYSFNVNSVDLDKEIGVIVDRGFSYEVSVKRAFVDAGLIEN